MSSTTSEHHSDIEDETPIVRARPQKRITNLYIKNFGTETTESTLCKLFGKYGTITSCKIQTDEDGRSKGFGFVNFENSIMAENAVANLNDYPLEEDKKLCVCFFQTKEDRQQEQQQAYYKTCEGRNLYISNLDQTIDDRKLKKAFDKYGMITSAKVMLERNQSKGCAFVCFSTIDEANEAIADMSGKELGSKPIYIALAKTRPTHPMASNNRYPQTRNFQPTPPMPSDNRYPQRGNFQPTPPMPFNNQYPQRGNFQPTPTMPSDNQYPQRGNFQPTPAMPFNNRYPQRRNFLPVSPVSTNYSDTSPMRRQEVSSPSDEDTQFKTRISSRLPSRTHAFINEQQLKPDSQENSKPSKEYSLFYAAALKSAHPARHTKSSDDDEED